MSEQHPLRNLSELRKVQDYLMRFSNAPSPSRECVEAFVKINVESGAFDEGNPLTHNQKETNDR
jgi:hypothetical protein